MKKFFKIFFIFIVVILAVLILTPLLFKKQILEKAKEVANTSVNAKVDFADLRLSLIRNFPNLSVSLAGVSVVNLEPFEGDTLVSFDEFRATVDLVSAIKMENIKVKGILLNNPTINAFILEDGTANYDIAPESETAPEEEVDTSSSGSMDMTIALKKFEIRSADLRYDDRSQGMAASMEDFNFILAGDLSEDFTSIEINSTTEKVNFIMDGIRYVKDAMLNIVIDADADMANSVFTLGENSVGINDLALKFSGVVSMPDEETIDMDVSFGTTRTEFKSLLSMVPAIFMSDFAGLQADGTLGLSGQIKGVLKGEQTPSADVELVVEDAMFSYPDLPKSADNININITAHYDGVDNDNTVLDINRFHVELGGNPVDFTLNLITPISDPQVSAQLMAQVDFGTLADVVPVEDTDIGGVLDAQVSMMGKMSSIEEERYEEFQADGRITLADFDLSSPDVPVPVSISKTTMLFSPEFVELQEFYLLAGTSDVSLKGRLENFIPYLFSDGTVSGNLDVSSSLLDANELIPESEEEEPEVVVGDTVEMTVVEVPANIHFMLNSNLKKVKYDKLEIDNIAGMIEVVDQKVILTRLGMELLDGSMVMNGEYNTQDITTPMVDFHFDMDHIDIPMAFEAFNTVKQLAPAAENATGNVSVELDFTSFLESNMEPDMNTVVGAGRLQSNNVVLDNSKVFDKIGDILKSDKYRTLNMNDLDIDFEIRNGRVYVDPFDVKLGRNVLKVSGDQGIDKTMNFNIAMSVPKSSLGSGAGSALDGLTSLAGEQGISLATGSNIDMNFLVSGMVDDPQVRPVFGSGSGGSVRQQATEQVREQVQEQVEEVKQEVRENIEEQKAKIMEEAEQEAQRIRDAAERAGDELIQQAQQEGDKRIADAGSNPIRKRAAEEYKKQLVKQAEEKAQKLQEEADEKAEGVLQRAREKADNL